MGIAVSGGPDSMALCWLMNKIYDKQIYIKCFTVDHGIRKGIIKIIFRKLQWSCFGSWIS